MLYPKSEILKMAEAIDLILKLFICLLTLFIIIQNEPLFVEEMCREIPLIVKFPLFQFNLNLNLSSVN